MTNKSDTKCNDKLTNHFSESNMQLFTDYLKERCDNATIEEIINPKSTIIETFKKLNEKDNEIAKAILEMGYDRTAYNKKDVSRVINKAIRFYLNSIDTTNDNSSES